MEMIVLVVVIVLVVLTGLGASLLWYLTEHIETTPWEAGKALICVAARTSVELVTRIYDPYRPYMATLGPADWQGWPPHALEPQHAVALAPACGGPSGRGLRLGHASVRLVDDRAKAQPH
jgi:hypothetical protein